MRPNVQILDVCECFYIVYKVIQYLKEYYISSDLISFSVIIIS